MSLHIECSAEETVTIKTTKRLKDCINVAHITYMNNVSQQSGSIFALLHTSSSKFSDNVSIYNIYVVKQNIACQRILNNWNIIHVDSFELIGTEPIHFVYECIEKIRCFSSSRWFTCKWRESERHTLSLYSCLVFSSNVRQLIVWFLSRGSGKTASLHPIGTSLRRAANTVNFVYL